MTDLFQTLPRRIPSLMLGRVPVAFSLRDWGFVAAGVVMAIGVTSWALLRRTITPEEMERLRRSFLAEEGRITDAMLVDFGSGDFGSGESSSNESRSGNLADEAPSVLRYQYRIAGVTYECAQDVSLLGERVRHLRMDLPVQVRYDPHNPTNSIVVSEIWSGLRQG